MTQNSNLKTFRYDLVIEAEDQQQADRVMIERVGYDEDLREYGVGEYRISANPVGDRQLDPVRSDDEASEDGDDDGFAPAINTEGPVTSVNGEQYMSLLRINRAIGGAYVLPAAKQVYVFGEEKYVLEFSYRNDQGSLQVRLNEEGSLHGADIERGGELTALTEGPLYDLIVGALSVGADA